MFAILRHGKMHTAGEIAGADRHNSRTRGGGGDGYEVTLNADPSAPPPQILVGPPGLLVEVVYARIAELTGGQRIRKNAVLVVDHLLTASPEYFRPGGGPAGTWDQPRTDAWVKANVAWLQQRWGDRLARATLHVDEATPHIHVHIVPVDARNHLNCRGIFGGSSRTLARLQDEYARAMQPLGLKRGVEGSIAKHERVKRYYAHINAPPQPVEVTLPPPKKSFLGEPVEEYVQRAEVALKEQIAPVAELVQDLQVRVERAEKRAQSLVIVDRRKDHEIRNQDREIASVKREAKQLKRERDQVIEQYRATPLEEIFTRLGAIQDRSDRHKWHYGDRAFGTFGPNQQKFREFTSAERADGGAVSLVMRMLRCDYKAAVAWFAKEYGQQKAEVAIVEEHVRPEVEQIVQTVPAPKTEFVQPAPASEHNETLRSWLVDERGIEPAVADHAIAEQLVYPVAHGQHINACFPLRDDRTGEVSGAALRGLRDWQDQDGETHKFRMNVAGSDVAGAHWKIGEGPEVILAESPVEAMSLLSLVRAANRHDAKALQNALKHPDNGGGVLEACIKQSIGQAPQPSSAVPPAAIQRLRPTAIRPGLVPPPRVAIAVPESERQPISNRVTIVSTNGLIPPRDMASILPASARRLTIGWNNDEPAHKAFEQLKQKVKDLGITVVRWFPTVNDWNDLLRSLREYARRIRQRITGDHGQGIPTQGTPAPKRSWRR